MEQKSPHFWWIICTLGIIIIALIAFILSNRVICADKIMEYISYASVILSITLSIFAILYTYTSNVQIQQQFEKINTAANTITSTSSNLTITGEKLNKNLDTILEHLESIDQSQQIMTSQLTDLNKQIDNPDVTNQLS
jgi:predicted PurR-regulated permease PerM